MLDLMVLGVSALNRQSSTGKHSASLRAVFDCNVCANDVGGVIYWYLRLGLVVQ